MYYIIKTRRKIIINKILTTKTKPNFTVKLSKKIIENKNIKNILSKINKFVISKIRNKKV